MTPELETDCAIVGGGLDVDKVETWHSVTDLDEIYSHPDEIRESVRRYL